MAKVKQLLTKKDQIEAKFNRFVEFVDNYSENRLDILKLKLDDFESILQNFENVQAELETLQQDKESINLIRDETAEFENKYFEVKAKAKRFLPNISTPVSMLSQSSIESKSTLPSLSLPSFGGTYEEWSQFRDTFKTLVDNNENLSNIQKFYYLLSTLKGEASRIIESLEVSNINYPIAWELLRERYENKRLAVNGHIRAILEMPIMIRENRMQLRNIADTLSRNLRCLKALQLPTEHWDALIVYIVSSKFDPTTKRDWETSLNSVTTLPTIPELQGFLNSKCSLLDSLQNKQAETHVKPSNRSEQTNKRTHAYTVTTNEKCIFCKGAHLIYNCEKFKTKTNPEKVEIVKSHKLCFNCLREGHTVEYCRSFGCYKCDKYHHTLLHIDHGQVKKTTDKDNNVTVLTTNHARTNNIQALLTTACVVIRDKNGKAHTCRALLDNGSQSNFITEELCELLKLKRRNLKTIVNGINSNQVPINNAVNVRICSKFNNFKRDINCLVLPNITGGIPTTTFEISLANLPPNLELADDTFNKNGKVDLLLGANTFWDILCPNQIRTDERSPILQQTHLGWIVAGPISMTTSSNKSKTQAYCALSKEISKFWEIEECSDEQITHMTTEEIECEKDFIKNTKRAPDGKFIVSIPFREDPAKLGRSEQTAVNRFFNLEKRLNFSHETKREYVKFMTDYETLGHMTKIENKDDDAQVNYYLPHHAVVKQDSLTTKLRTVFDGSAKTSSGISLNDIQMVGPIVQSELFSILVRFRQHRYVISADIEKMYRQIWINKRQRNLQRIIWRSSDNEPLEHFYLNTITYGLSASPYLATRCLKELAVTHNETNPEAARAIRDDMYVDDYLTGGETIEELILIRDDTIKILNSAKLNLRKWLSNDTQILKGIRQGESTHEILSLEMNETNKILGLQWNPNTDTLQYKTVTDTDHPLTKRSILSVISKLWDPLGYLGPLVVVAKLLMQELWQLKLSWDEPLPDNIRESWFTFQSQLSIVNEIKIHRHAICKNPRRIELHGFSDASLKAYAACVYVKSSNKNGDCLVNLIAAKSRVAPLKTITLPRLELCGALLLAKLMKRVKNDLRLKIDSCHLWCDSTITLSWIKTDAKKLKIFVSNRVAEINKLTNKIEWHYVSTHDNAADVLSRGTKAKDLIKNELWWHGPTWLKLDRSFWPIIETNFNINDCPEYRETRALMTTTIKGEITAFIEKFSSLHTLTRVTAWCLRFSKNSKLQKNERLRGPLDKSEVQGSLELLVKLVQIQEFIEYQVLTKRQSLSPTSKLLSLTPFLDDKGLIRVGGRLNYADLDYSNKHPILLPKGHHLCTLIATQLHVENLHCGPQLLLNILRETYWPISGRNLTKTIVHKCIKCFKADPKIAKPPMMGNLPKERLTPGVFQNCGLDFAGPFLIKDKKTRGARLTKHYICLFVCFATRAIHLELVGSLHSESFLAALRRFVARRGVPQTIYSDNATNFKGAQRELAHLANAAKAENVRNFVINKNINFKYIPPQSPHFGGLWEAGVRSVKYHLKRIAGSANFIYEEFNTFLAQIESILNSRPLSPLSSNPNDLNPLTPGHFIIGRPMNALPDESLRDVPSNRLIRFQHVQLLVQHFWTRWTKEYLNELQLRKKWRKITNPIKEGVLVIIRNEGLLPNQWKLGRVTQVHPGKDGVVRVVTVKTASGEKRRAIHTLCELPID